MPLGPRALAKLHRMQDTLSAIGAADEALDRGGGDADRSWEAPYDHAWHRALTGLALFDLALAGRTTQAGAHLAYAVTRFAPGAVRARAIAETKYASLLMVTDDARHAAAVGTGRSTPSSTSTPRGRRRPARAAPPGCPPQRHPRSQGAVRPHHRTTRLMARPRQRRSCATSPGT
jgi:hypothetical protein